MAVVVLTKNPKPHTRLMLIVAVLPDARDVRQVRTPTKQP